jgi:hypothetical protein
MALVVDQCLRPKDIATKLSRSRKTALPAMAHHARLNLRYGTACVRFELSGCAGWKHPGEGLTPKILTLKNG